MEVPMLSRVGDYAYSQMHCSNFYTCTGITFPISNYSVSFDLMKRIGFWDTVEDAIGEDVHTTIKLFWKTQGEI